MKRLLSCNDVINEGGFICCLCLSQKEIRLMKKQEYEMKASFI